MKFLKIISIFLISTLVLTSCGEKDKNNNDKQSSSVPPSSEISDLVEPVMEKNNNQKIEDVSNGSSQEQSSNSSEQYDQPSTNETSSSAKPNILEEQHDFYSLPNKQIVWGPGAEVDEDNRPTAPVNLQDKYGKYGSYFIAENDNNIYLTFDEGYENGYTPVILDTLKEKNVSAVFFVTMDYVKTSPELVQRMIDEGHIIGNHTYKHPNMTQIDATRVAEEIQTLHDYVLENFKYEMWLFRPPEGAFSERTLAQTHSLGYINVLWSFAYADWDQNKQPDVATGMKRVTECLHPGAIYLLHAVSSTNATILGDFIDTARGQGYEFKTFDLKDPSNNQSETTSQAE